VASVPSRPGGSIDLTGKLFVWRTSAHHGQQASSQRFGYTTSGMQRPTPELREVADGVFAYLQGEGGWGFSNAGLVIGGAESLLVDTLYDERLTRLMLESMRKLRSRALAIQTVINTHANGDHCWGNALLPRARIVSTKHAADEMREQRPGLMRALVSAARLVERSAPLRRSLRLLARLRVPHAAALLEAAPFVAQNFGAFAFEEVRLRLPDTTFSGTLSLQLGERSVLLEELGPAHTRGDTIVHLPDARVVFTGDLLFAGAHPIAWEGPITGWIAACDRLLALDVDVVVPGHGPLSTKREVAATKHYFERLLADVERARAAGLGIEECARALAAEWKLDWREQSRLVVNVHTAYRELAGESRPPHPLTLLAAMARFERGATKGAAR
jgi:cyclase